MTSETPCENVLGHYIDTLKLAQSKGYTFITYDDLLLGEPEEPFILLRHDVEMFLEPASRMRMVEDMLSVRSNWFFRTRALHYNLMSPQTHALLDEILLYNESHIGLHLDTSADPLQELALFLQMLRTFGLPVVQKGVRITCTDPHLRPEVRALPSFVDNDLLSQFNLSISDDSAPEWHTMSLCRQVEHDAPRILASVHPWLWYGKYPEDCF